jgi:hypothetical protein
MKKLIISSFLTSIFFSLYVFFFYSTTLEFAIIPRWAVPFSAIASFLHKSPGFLIALIYISGLSVFAYTIYLLTEIIQTRTKNWWKTSWFSLVTAIVILYAFIYSLNFYFYPKVIPTNNLVPGFLVFSTILFFPLKELKKYIVTYIVFLISYFIILECYGNTLLLDKNIALFFYPAYIILLYLLVYQFLMNKKLERYLIVLLIFIPIKFEQRKEYTSYYTEKKTADYTMIIPSANFYRASTLKRPFTSISSYMTILEPDSIIYAKRALYIPFDYLSFLKSLNLNEERIKKVEELFRNKNLYIGKVQKERLEEILERWEKGEERGVISVKIKGEIPDRVGLLHYTGKRLNQYKGTLITNVADAIEPVSDGVTVFRNVPPGKYELILFYKKLIPRLDVEIPIIESNNDTVDMGTINIR